MQKLNFFWEKEILNRIRSNDRTILGELFMRYKKLIFSHIQSHGGSEADLDLVLVPGAFELPMGTERLLSTGKYDAVCALGAVIRGATPHFDYVSAEATKGIATVSLKYAKPVAFGLLTTDTIEQAIERAGTKAGNKGFEAALTAVEMANLLKQLG